MTEYLTAKELVERYKGTIKAGTLANWRANRRGPPFVKLEGRIMYPLDSLIEWEKSRTRQPAA